MKKIFLALLVCAGITSNQAIAQGSVCTGFHKKYCYMEGTKRDNKAFLYNAQSKSGLFAQGTVSKMRCVVYKGMDYRISVCCEGAENKVNFKIYDGRTNEELFDNTKNDNAQQFEFQAGTSRQLIIEATVPFGGDVKEEKGKAESASCVGLLIENKVSDRVGFSQY